MTIIVGIASWRRSKQRSKSQSGGSRMSKHVTESAETSAPKYHRKAGRRHLAATCMGEGPCVPDPEPAFNYNHDRSDHVYWAYFCTCGMAEQERTGHYPEHWEWCDVPSPLDDEDMRTPAQNDINAAERDAR